MTEIKDGVGCPDCNPSGVFNYGDEQCPICKGMAWITKADMYRVRYIRAGHAVQSGVKTELELLGAQRAGADPKHLRVGVNMAMVDSGAVATLLIKKGIITEEEYLEALAVGVEEEVKKYEERLFKKTGTSIKLG